MSDAHKDELVLSYTRVRFALGVLGFLLPVVLILGGLLDTPRVDRGVPDIEATISDFYHMIYRDIFVGCLCAIGVFLISYRGYRREPGEVIDDDWLATIAGIAAFGVAFFPNEAGGEVVVAVTQNHIGLGITPVIHYSFALVFFLCLATFCLYKFPKNAKPHRRRVYLTCGWVIVAALLLTAVCVYFKRFTVDNAVREMVLDNNLIFWFETIGIWAFAVSWLAKSKADLVLAQKVRRGPAGVIEDDDSVLP